MNEIRIPPGNGQGTACTSSHAAAVEVINALLRALKAYRLYLPSHPLLKDFVAAFHGGLVDYLDAHAELTLKIGQSNIVLEDEAVYASASREESLAFRLFINGVREITFHRGLTLPEVSELLRIIRRTFDSNSDVDELLAALWERDMDHVDFIVLEDFFDDEDAAEYKAFRQDTRRQREPSHSCYGPETGQVPLRPSISEKDRASLPALLRLSVTDQSRLEEIVGQVTERTAANDIAALLPDIVLHCAGAGRTADLDVIFQATVEAVLSEGDIDAAVRLLDALHDQATSSDGAAASVRLSTQGLLAALRPRFPTFARTGPSVLARLLDRLAPGVAPWLADLIGDPDCSEPAAAQLRLLSPRSLVPLVDRLTTAPQVTAMILLRLFGDARVTEALPALSGFLLNSDTKLRREALNSIRKIGTTASLQPLLQVLVRRDPELTILAARALKEIPPGSHLEALLPLASSKDFGKRAPIERNDMLMAIGRAGTSDCEEFLLRLARRKTLFRRAQWAPLRAGAVAALAQSENPNTRVALEALTQDRSPEVRRAASLALR